MVLARPGGLGADHGEAAGQEALHVLVGIPEEAQVLVDLLRQPGVRPPHLGLEGLDDAAGFGYLEEKHVDDDEDNHVSEEGEKLKNKKVSFIKSAYFLHDYEEEVEGVVLGHEVLLPPLLLLVITMHPGAQNLTFFFLF